MKTIKICDIKNYESYDGYTINELGEIYSYIVPSKNKRVRWDMEPLKMKPTVKSNGYLHLGLTDGEKRIYPTVHRLLALSFIPNPKNYKCVNHIDGNKLNNSLENLEWVSHKANSQHAYTIDKNFSNSNGRNKRINQYDLNNNFIKQYTSATDAANSLNFKKGGKSAILRACRNQQKTSGGYIWKFANNAKSSTTSRKT